MITQIATRDARDPIGSGHGSDAIHRDPISSYAVTILTDTNNRTGSGLAFTPGEGDGLVCKAATSRKSSPTSARCKRKWPASNACWDLWAKTRGVPFWKPPLDLTPVQAAATLDLSYLEDVLTPAQAPALLTNPCPGRAAREGILASG